MNPQTRVLGKPIKDEQIRTLIAIRDMKGINQKDLYTKISSIIGRSIGRLKHISRAEANSVILELNTSENKVNSGVNGIHPVRLDVEFVPESKIPDLIPEQVEKQPEPVKTVPQDEFKNKLQNLFKK